MNSIVTILALVATVSVQAAPLPNGAIPHWREPITLSDFPSNIEHQWSQLALSAPRMTEWQRLSEVNRIFNQVTKVSDLRKWGRKDYWATPEEFLQTKGGDCEDFAVAKYFAL